jgi:hypothetical protein
MMSISQPSDDLISVSQTRYGSTWRNFAMLVNRHQKARNCFYKDEQPEDEMFGSAFSNSSTCPTPNYSISGADIQSLEQ